MEQEESLKDKVDKLIQTTEAGKSAKQPMFKLPFMVNMQKGKALRKEWAVVLFIRTNGSIQIQMRKVEDDTITFKDYIYDARAGNILRYKKLPFIIIKEWNISPEAPPEKHVFNPTEDFAKASQEGKLTAAEKLILTKMKMEAIKPKMQINMGMLLLAGAVLVGGYFLLAQIGVI